MLKKLIDTIIENMKLFKRAGWLLVLTLLAPVALAESTSTDSAPADSVQASEPTEGDDASQDDDDNPVDESKQIRSTTDDVTGKALSSIQTGMLDDNVRTIMGDPELTLKDDNCEFLYYGSIWVWALDRVVKGYITVDEWQGPECWKYYQTYEKFEPQDSFMDSVFGLFN